MTIAASSRLNGFNMPAPSAQETDKCLNKVETNAEQRNVSKDEKLTVVIPPMQPPAEQTVPRFQQTVNLSATQGQQKWSGAKQHGNTMVCSPLEV